MTIVTPSEVVGTTPHQQSQDAPAWTSSSCRSVSLHRGFQDRTEAIAVATAGAGIAIPIP